MRMLMPRSPPPPSPPYIFVSCRSLGLVGAISPSAVSGAEPRKPNTFWGKSKQKLAYNYHNITARFSNKDFITQKFEYCMVLLATPLKCRDDAPEVENPWSTMIMWTKINKFFFFFYSALLLLSVWSCRCDQRGPPSPLQGDGLRGAVWTGRGGEVHRHPHTRCPPHGTHCYTPSYSMPSSWYTLLHTATTCYV